MTWFSVYNRRLYAVIVSFGATTAMVLDHQPLLWVAVALIGGLILGWFTAPRRPNT